MKYLVKLYVGGTTWDEEVIATNPKDARETALARNPKAKVIGVNVKFWVSSCHTNTAPQNLKQLRSLVCHIPNHLPLCQLSNWSNHPWILPEHCYNNKVIKKTTSASHPQRHFISFWSSTPSGTVWCLPDDCEYLQSIWYAWFLRAQWCNSLYLYDFCS